MRTAAQEIQEGATCRLTYVETRAALARMRAAGRLKPATHVLKLQQFGLIWSRVAVLDIDEGLVERAAGLAERHVLRAYDSVQLASALSVSEAEAVTFACWDDDLRAAAAHEGLGVLPDAV